MDSRPIGSDTLLYIDTEKVRFSLSGPSHAPIGKKYKNTDSRISLYSPFRTFLFAKGSKEDGSNLSCDNVFGNINVIPLLFEQTTYQVHIETDEGNNLKIFHESSQIRNQIQKRSKKYPVYDGAINFGNDIGYSEFVIYLNGKEHIRIILEVFPSKIDYKEDYQNLLCDITKETYSLIFDFLKKTYSEFSTNKNKKSSFIEFFAIITKIYQSFLVSLNLFLKSPHHILISTEEVVPFYKAKRLDSKGMKWIRTHGLSFTQGGKVLSSKKRITFDTDENRFIRLILELTIRKLTDFSSSLIYLKRNDEDISEVKTKCNRMIFELKRKIQNSFLKDITPLPHTSSLSLVFTMGLGYKDLYRYYFQLNHGLSINGNMFHSSLKDVALLYEYWCFIKLNSLLKEDFGLVSNNLFKITRNGINVNLEKGKKSEMVYENVYNGEQIKLYYNRQEKNSPTTAQKPDNVLALIKNKDKEVFEFIFDAKYRINIPGSANDQYDHSVSDLGTPGPVLDSINTMHRYRDAIVSMSSPKQNGFERTMFGAYVLFPYADEEEYKNHHFYKSIKTVNIGGLPFLPGHTQLVKDFLENLIAESSDCAFSRSVLPLGIDSRLKKISWKRDVLIGALTGKEEFDFCIQNHLYYVPVSQTLDDAQLPIHYVALYQSKKIFGEHSGILLSGEVIRCYKTKRKNIPNLNAKKGKEENWYFVFEVKKWDNIRHPILVKEHGVSNYILTTQYLMRQAREFPDLEIQNERQWRVYLELKRKTQDSFSLQKENTIGFNFENYFFSFAKHKLTIYQLENRVPVYDIPSAFFQNNPHQCFEEICDRLKL